MVKTVYNKPSKFMYIRKVIMYVLTPSFLYDISYRQIYIIVNQLLPRKIITSGSMTKIHPTVTLRHAENIVVGSNCLINHNNVLQGGKTVSKIIIGDFVHTGPGVMMFAYNHRFDAGLPSIEQGYVEQDIIIGNDVWIGANSVILAGTIIEDGVVVAASSLVRGRLEKGHIYGGNPIRKLGVRT
jgi:maltose O-acetyltransferase